MHSSIEDIREQEADIFEELGDYDFQNEPNFRKVSKEKARQQLAVSEDSPFFNLTNQDIEPYDEVERRRLKEERASLLREETKEIRRQLDFVKSRLSQLRQTNGIEGSNNNETVPDHHHHSQITENDDRAKVTNEDLISNKPTTERGSPSVPKLEDRQPTSEQTSTDKKGEDDKNIGKRHNIKHSETKFRPLTGKVDCPNCDCDRRSSVCSECISIASTQPNVGTRERKDTLQLSETTSGSSNQKKGSYYERRRIEESKEYQWDERPIRPAKDRTIARVEAVDEVVVPSRVYTISKSLNEKRSKLAQAISELQLITDQVKERGNRLEEERKLVQLYKDQWKYGPSIGGPKASSRERLCRTRAGRPSQRNYESRLDPNLRRDSNSIMGYRDVEPVMRLRQYKTPVPAPRTKLTGSNGVQANRASVHSRSKSLESLRPQPFKTRSVGAHAAMENFRTGNRSSALDLTSEPGVSATSKDLVTNQEAADDGEESSSMPDAIRVSSPTDSVVVINDESNELNQRNIVAQTDSVVGEEENKKETPSGSSKSSGGDEKATGRLQRMTWIPVFGETEIKTVTKKTPKRKLQIVKSTQNRAQTQQQQYGAGLTRTRNNANKQLSSFNGPAQSNQSRSNVSKQKLKSSLRNSGPLRPALSNRGELRAQEVGSRLIGEASRKLKFASDLLEQEKFDSESQNQLLIRKPQPRPRLKQKPQLQNENHVGAEEERTSPKVPMTSRANNSMVKGQSTTTVNMEIIKEISRLEEMVNEQKKLLTKLASVESSSNSDINHRHLLVSPVALSCSSPCCHHHATTSNSSQCSSPCPQHSRQTNSSGSRSLISSLRERLNKTKVRLAKTLEEEREKHQRLKLKVDSSLRKQSDLENENELLKQSLSKCIDTCLKDISNTFESLSDTLTDSMVASQTRHVDSNKNGKIDSVSGFALSNATQLISDNKHLKQMKSHIESIELQRKVIFDELSKEKQRSNLLELQLKESQKDLNKLTEAKQNLESQMACAKDKQELSAEDQSTSTTTGQEQMEGTEKVYGDYGEPPISIKPSSSANLESVSQSEETAADRSTTFDDSTYNSVDVYQRYIQSISPDIESLRRERKMILSEFDNIKRMLSDMDK